LHGGLKIATITTHKLINMETRKLRLAVPWDEVKEKLKEAHIDLTDEDLDYEPGKEDELLDRLQQKINKSKEAIQGWIESISMNEGMAG
jgi:uncharacterized protein YjbJ (UPF0337 family)